MVIFYSNKTPSDEQMCYKTRVCLRRKYQIHCNISFSLLSVYRHFHKITPFYTINPTKYKAYASNWTFNGGLPCVLNTYVLKLNDFSGKICMYIYMTIWIYANVKQLPDDGRVSLTEYMQAFHLPHSIAEPYFNLYADPDGYMRSNVIASYLHLLDNNGNLISFDC